MALGKLLRFLESETLPRTRRMVDRPAAMTAGPPPSMVQYRRVERVTVWIIIRRSKFTFHQESRKTDGRNQNLYWHRHLLSQIE